MTLSILTISDIMARAVKVRVHPHGSTRQSRTLLEQGPIMAANNPTAHRTDYPDSKPCVVCGKMMRGEKPSRLTKRLTCGPVCKRIYQSGPFNPNWRGGPGEIICARCGARKAVGRTITGIVKYCSRKCLSEANAERNRGESSPAWKGGRQASKVRYLERQGKLPGLKRKKAERICPKCGLPIVGKSRTYHFDCSPLRQRKGRILAKCIDCGKERMIHPRFGVVQARCQPCYSKRVKGSMNPNWKGGITPKNKKIRASERYKAWRTAVFERDKYTCIWCSQKGGKLNADHIKPFSTHKRLRFELSNGRTLCVACHKKTDTYMAKAVKKKRRRFKQLDLFA
jgi:hypothetical protein